MADTENSIVETQGVPSVELLAEAVDTPVVEQDVEVFGMTETAVDKTLTISDCAADAKATGDAIADLAADISDISVELDKKIESVPDMTGATEQEAGAAGLAPAPSAGDQNKYLKADGTWSNVPEMTGATALLDGTSGLAPAPVAGDQTKFLKGDGTWDDVPDPQVMTGATAQEAGTSGLTPVPAAGDQGKFLKGDGTWADVPGAQVMTGATAQEAGTSGLAPAPAAGDQGKFLKGDGTWSNVPDPQVMTGATAQDAGTSGLTPAPAAGDQNKYLKADGTWSNVPDPQVMTGATEQAAGTSGLVPAPAAGDQGKMLNGGGQWALPGVVTINGRSPNPVTGDIVVIEGGGSSSYGSYRLDAVIDTTDWVEDNGAYVAQVTNSLITANMDGVETWLDDESAMLGDTSFATSEGMLTITTAVMPVASWSLHVSLAVNGADVLADVSALQTAVTNLQASDAAQTANMSKIIPILSGDANNTGYTINSGEYFEVEGTLYKATAAIPNGSAWAGSATAMGAGETAINSLNSKIKTVTIPASRLNTRGGSGYWFYAERSNITDLIPASATILSVFRGNWDSSNDGVPYAYGNVVGIVFTSVKSANDVALIVTYM